MSEKKFFNMSKSKWNRVFDAAAKTFAALTFIVLSIQLVYIFKGETPGAFIKIAVYICTYLVVGACALEALTDEKRDSYMWYIFFGGFIILFLTIIFTL